MSDDKKESLNSADRALLLDHNYDGIQELNHPLPRWWLIVFYATIVFALGYAAYYWIGPGLNSNQLLEIAMKDIAAKRPKETTVVINESELKQTPGGPDHLKLGAKIFSTRCTPCHGANGQGVIGPNLTDAFWIHGKGSLNDIAKVIHEGVTEKGMPAWSEVLSADELKDVAVYVKSINGTHPAGPKAPQGEKYE